MKTSVPSLPARIVKRADVDAGPARPTTTGGAVPADATVPPEEAPARRLAKQARLVPGAPGTSAVEVRCACGEWTRIELKSVEGGQPEERR